MHRLAQRAGRALLVAASVLAAVTGGAFAAIPGVTGTDFSLAVKADFILTPDGGTYTIWGYADVGSDPGARAQYPGPTLILEEGDLVTIRLRNDLGAQPVSLVIPGFDVAAEGGTPGLLTQEAAPNGGTVTYRFVADRPGTFLYQSGTRMDLQVEMGLVGAIIVRPKLGPKFAYNHPGTAFDDEFLFLQTEMDPNVHDLAEFDALDLVDMQERWPVYWFLNGRNAPDTMGDAFVPWLPTQPYNCMPMFEAGRNILFRVVVAGHDLHPFHHHGNHSRIIAKDGFLLESAPGAGPDLSHETFTIQSVPGQTYDAFYGWTGQGLAWDPYGHAPGDPLVPGEDASAHGVPIPVDLPPVANRTIGAMFGGSPFLGQTAPLPPGVGGMNPEGAYAFMLHSHTEKEMVNFDLFPGGMMTMIMVMAPAPGQHHDMP